MQKSAKLENFRERPINANIVKNETGKTLTENKGKVSRCVEYIGSLYKGGAIADFIENENKVQNDDMGDSISKKEFEKALKGMKVNKASGVDLIAAELLQNLWQAGIIILFKLVCDMYETGDISNDYKVNKTVTIPK